ncbi:hypothetical protein [Burkholderia cepacia]|uniref:hypothetical protein n=1 Tax=Burkholderia cepacia TaxID=292 RepID=UPI0013F41298|nr:hypothetical protein [Burkholderia cepacia]NHB06592.1 hypothetical protein [Burkholderia cepacia]
MANTLHKSASLMSDGQRVLEIMEPGKAYEPATLASQLGMRASSVRAWLEHWVAAGKLEQGMFLNAGGSRRSCFFVHSRDAALCTHDEARRIVPVDVKGVFDAMKPGVGYRVREVAAQHVLPLHRATTFLALLVKEGQVVKRTVGGTHRRHDLYYIAGTEPDAQPQAEPMQATSRIPRPLAAQPAYDAEYARSLRSLYDICTKDRGRN